MNINHISRIASLVGEPARTAMLLELMDGRALTAGELARAAGIGAPTASAHLAQLIDAQLLRVTPAGRHRYHRLASSEVARMLESIMQVAAGGLATHPRVVVGPKHEALRAARTCYDHLAGRLGVAITERLQQHGALVLADEGAYLTDKGGGCLAGLGIAPADRSSALSCRPCLDWSERRFHLAGRLASSLCRHCLEQGWLRKRPQARALDITPRGSLALQNWLGMALWASVQPPQATTARE
ncbi:MAG: winged helix-turn-helix domain-containing protein, partial [Rubrivivax sp.]